MADDRGLYSDKGNPNGDLITLMSGIKLDGDEDEDIGDIAIKYAHICSAYIGLFKFINPDQREI